MAFTTNRVDGTRIYFEDTRLPGPPLVFMYGFMDPVPAARALPIARRLQKHARLIYVDHRGHGLSDKPQELAAYDLELRVGDVTAVLDELGIDRAHYLGISWGARLGFALGQHAPDRLLSLTLNGNQPYEWNREWPIVGHLTAALAASRDGGAHALLAWFEAFTEKRLPRKARQWILENDPVALDAAWTAALSEGPIAISFGHWHTPCLIAAGESDDFHANAERAAREIPGACFISLTGRDHLTAIDEVDRLMPKILELLQT